MLETNKALVERTNDVCDRKESVI